MRSNKLDSSLRNDGQQDEGLLFILEVKMRGIVKHIAWAVHGVIMNEGAHTR
jgi:hypothetical protein